jgi:hypothetical protein
MRYTNEVRGCTTKTGYETALQGDTTRDALQHARQATHSKDSSVALLTSPAIIRRRQEARVNKPNPSSQGIPGGTPAQTGSRRDARIFGPGGTPAQAGPGRQAGLVLREPVNSFNTCSIPDPDDSCQEVHAKNVRFLRQRSGRTHHQFFEKIGLGSQSTMDEVRIRDW